MDITAIAHWLASMVYALEVWFHNFQAFLNNDKHWDDDSHADQWVSEVISDAQK